MVSNELFDFLKIQEDRGSDYRHSQIEKHPEVHQPLKETAYNFGNVISQFDKDIDQDFLDPFLRIQSCLGPRNDNRQRLSRPYFLITVCKDSIWEESAGYYVQIYADRCYLGGGIHLPGKNALRKIRSEILVSAGQWLQIVSGSDFEQLFTKGLCTSRRLKKMPLGYSQRGKVASYIKMSDFFTNEEFPKEVFLNAQNNNKIAGFLQATKPLVDFLNRGLEQTISQRAKLDLLSIIGF